MSAGFRFPKVAAFALTAVATLSLSQTVFGNDPGAIHYPDLQTLPPFALTVSRSHGHVYVRFSNTVANRGPGPLEVFPQNNPDGTTDAFQRLFSHDAAGQWYAVGTNYCGKFAFHPEHDHWHFEDFALYELRDVASDGSIGSTVLVTSGKVTFCLVDYTQVDSTLEHASPQTYTTCGVDLPQGISVGWGDVYGWYLAGQSLEITGLPSGNYWLVSTADPNNRLAEGGGATETNNVGAVKIRIERNKSVKIVP